MKEFIQQTKQYGLRVAFGNWLIGVTKRVTGAERIQLTYHKRGGGKK